MKRMLDGGKFSFANGANASYVEELYQRFSKDPNSVEASWRSFFEGFEFALTSSKLPAGSVSSGDDRHSVLEAHVESYINLYRRLGHLNAYLNPLDKKPELADFLKPEENGLASVSYDETFHPTNLADGQPRTFRDIHDLLVETYTRSIGADFRDINDIEAIVWFQTQMEGCRNRPPLDRNQKLRIFDKLVEAEGFERFLQDRYLGQKRFSVEGLESLIPLLDTITMHAGDTHVQEICLGMAHRGRLNVLANYMGKPYELMLKEFEGSELDSYGIDGDVKYHKGFANYFETLSGKKLRVYLSPNPSHLEAVNPVVEGFTRARQEMLGDRKQSTVLPILIHGDASFIGQGIVAETFNLSELDAYETGGTIHIITNNQVGFTTNPSEGRSCHYSSEIAKIVRAPVLHVNADDPEAVVWTAYLAVLYRQRFQKDIVIDLIGYRRHGHNETDEPSFTQPQMYKFIKSHPTVLKIYGEQLVSEGLMKETEVKDRIAKFRSRLQEYLDQVRSDQNVEILSTVPKELEKSLRLVKVDYETLMKPAKTTVDRKTLEMIVKQAVDLPKSFKPHPKIEKLFRSRLKMIEDEGAIDWGLGEWLAFGSLALEKKHVRLSGQDCRRGTFSHRHAVIRDYETGNIHGCLDHLSDDQGRVEVINSPLSEQGVLGFEFGYSVANPDALVLWEAQFGDFSNGAQIIIDQFLVASEAKWKQTCGLVLLLPHGYEGMGPEHSSARPERFLQLCGDWNIQVANLTTPAQLFHILRRQLVREFRKPLIIMTPKSLLRHPQCISTWAEFTENSFREVIDDQNVEDKTKVQRVVFCSGKIYYDLLKGREQLENPDHFAIVRIEQLYPFPEKQVDEILKSYTNAKEVLWTQEEPSNMGAWTFIRHRIKKLSTRSRRFRYAGRASAGTTAEGSVKSHEKEQARIISDALTIEAESSTRSKARRTKSQKGKA